MILRDSRLYQLDFKTGKSFVKILSVQRGTKTLRKSQKYIATVQVEAKAPISIILYQAFIQKKYLGEKNN